MKTTASLLLVGVAAAALPVLSAPARAADVDVSKLPPPAAKQSVTYAKDIRPIFEASCFRCHGEQRPRGGLRLDSLEAALKGGEDGKVLTPGKSAESQLVIAVAQIDDETAMPPKPGRGRGGPGGRGGFGPGMMLAGQMVAQGDKNNDKALSKDEFTALADAWFDKMDADKAGKLSQEQFVEKFAAILPAPQGGRGMRGGPGGPGGAGGPGGPANAGNAGPQRGGQPNGQGGGPGGPGGGPGGPGGLGGPGGPGGPGGRGGFGPARFIAPGLFTATDADKDGSLTRAEFKDTFAKWFDEWDADKSGSLNADKLRDGLNKVLPQPNFGGRAGPDGPGGAGGPGGPGGAAGRGGPGGPNGPGNGPGGRDGRGGQAGPPPPPLTPEQVGLVRAWIDQGAK